MKEGSKKFVFLRDLTKGQKTAVIILSTLMLILSIGLPLFVNRSSIERIRLSRSYRVGELSDETIISPVDFSYVDTDETENLRNEAKKSVLPQFAFEVSNSLLMRSRSDDLIEIMDIEDDQEREKALSNYFSLYGIDDNSGAFNSLSSLDPTERRVMSRLIGEAVNNAISQGIMGIDDLALLSQNGWSSIELESLNPSDMTMKTEKMDVIGLLSTVNIPSYAVRWIEKIYPDFPLDYLDMTTLILQGLLISNISYDQFQTEKLMEEKANEVEPVHISVKKGDLLLERDKLVTREELATISHINSEPYFALGPTELIGEVIFSIVAILFYLFFAINSISYKYRKGLFLIIALSFFIFSQVLDFVIVLISLRYNYFRVTAFLPMLISPMLISAFTNRERDGLYIGILFGALQIFYPTSNIYTFFFIVISVAFCLYSMRVRKERLSTLIEWLIASISEVLVVFVFSLLASYSWNEMGISILGSLINITLAFLIYSIVLPIFERLFNIPTSFRLHDLSYTDNPTLQRLNQVALGTFNHVRNVSEMAYEAAKKIGANAELARVGALYHDIGKAEHPEYFVENQSGKNAHDVLSSTLSAAVIKSHVKIGIEKAKEIGLPQEVIDIIGEHHGNDLIKYFYDEAVKNNPNRTEVSEEDFRYTGNIPSTPESGIVMLADCTEAATRTIKNPTHQKYDKFITKIFSDKIAHNQLNDSKLTLTDLEKIKNAFIHYLLGRDHSRIEYDNQDV